MATTGIERRKFNVLLRDISIRGLSPRKIPKTIAITTPKINPENERKHVSSSTLQKLISAVIAKRRRKTDKSDGKYFDDASLEAICQKDTLTSATVNQRTNSFLTTVKGVLLEKHGLKIWRGFHKANLL